MHYLRHPKRPISLKNNAVKIAVKQGQDTQNVKISANTIA